MDDSRNDDGFVELSSDSSTALVASAENLDVAMTMRPRRGPEIIDFAIEVLMSRLLGIVGVCALIWLPMRILAPFAIEQMTRMQTDPEALDGMSMIIAGGVTLANFGAQMLAGILGTMAVTLLVYGELVGRPITAMAAIRKVMSRFFSLIGMYIIIGSVVAAGLVALIGLSILCPVFIFGALAYYAIFTWRWAMAPSALVLENMPVIPALRRSWNLCTGSFWRWVCVILLSTLLVSGFSALLGLGDTVETRDLFLTSLGLPEFLFHVIFVPISALLSGIATAVGSGAMTVFYLDQRMRVEGFDLTMRLERLKAMSASRTAGESTLASDH